MNNLLITPARAAEIAFADSTASTASIAADYITPTAIAAAQNRYIASTLGKKLYKAALGGKYNELVEEYVHPPLAMFLRAMVLPGLWAQAGRSGVVRSSGESLKSVSESELLRLVRAAKTDARMLLGICADHIGSSPDLYPEYEPAAEPAGNIF